MQLSKSVELKSVANRVDTLIVRNNFAQAQISLFGGHVLSYVPVRDKRERLWMSRNAVLDGTKAIRGGVPVCWPWFGDHPSKDLAAHGYVRTQQWHLVDSLDTDVGTVVNLKPQTAIDAGIDGDVDLQLTVIVGNELTIHLATRNLGKETVEFGAALHSYFNVEDISRTQLHGLSGDFLDKTENFARKVTPDSYRFETETDNIHLNPVSHAVIDTGNFSIEVESHGHDSIVVWNPWIDKSAAMTDMPDDGYQFMLCVESAITRGVVLAASEQHTLTQIIR